MWNNILPDLGNPTPRPPRKIDTQLSVPLTSLPGSAVPPPDPTKDLAVRNTIRGKRVGLPSGQQVARAMRAPVLSNATLGLSNDPGWKGEAPLWFYILKEAELPPYNGKRLGRWPDRRRGPRRAPAAGPQLIPLPRPGLETRPTDRINDRTVHLRRPAQIRRRRLSRMLGDVVSVPVAGLCLGRVVEEPMMRLGGVSVWLLVWCWWVGWWFRLVSSRRVLMIRFSGGLRCCRG